MLLPHLPSVKSLAELLAARMLQELRARKQDAAWTNLMAMTRLAVAWEPEPTEVSKDVRFNLVRVAWKAAWQGVQAHQWTEEQLRAIQREWQAADFFKGLPETMAFTRACLVDSCLQERQTPPRPGPPVTQALNKAIRSPASLMSETRRRWERAQYRAVGTYEDERDLLLFYRDREVELRHGITASTWLKMRVLPAVGGGRHRAGAISVRARLVSRGSGGAGAGSGEECADGLCGRQTVAIPAERGRGFCALFHWTGRGG
jgi:hypothetical protein